MLNLKGQKMLNQFASLSLADQKAMLASMRDAYNTNRANMKAAKIQAREAKALAKAAKVEASIAKAQARLQKLLEKQAAPVGVKALKANRKPSKVVTYGAEDNAIAGAIMAKKASAVK
jgi:FKBP-type peptidyl-prolyl cis-trans isomerase